MLQGQINAADFHQQMSILAKNFCVLPLSDAVTKLQSETLPAKAVSITFDDGYADNVEVALPILQQWQLPATFFISTGFLDGGCMWNDAVIEAVRVAPGPFLDLSDMNLGKFDVRSISQRQQTIQRLIAKLKYLPQEERGMKAASVARSAGAKLPDNLMMSSDQVRLLSAAGMEIGGHTVNHPILSGLSESVTRDEIMQGRKMLEEITGKPVHLFAYPNGTPGLDYTSEHIKLLKELGFFAAVSTAYGAATSDGDCYQMPRFTPWDTDEIRFTLRLLKNCLRRKVTAV